MEVSDRPEGVRLVAPQAPYGGVRREGTRNHGVVLQWLMRPKITFPEGGASTSPNEPRAQSREAMAAIAQMHQSPGGRDYVRRPRRAVEVAFFVVLVLIVPRDRRPEVKRVGVIREPSIILSFLPRVVVEAVSQCLGPRGPDKPMAGCLPVHGAVPSQCGVQKRDLMQETA